MRVFHFLLEKDDMGLRFWERELFRKGQKANTAALAELCRQMSFMLSAGLGLRSLMTVLAEGSGGGFAYKSQGKSPYMRYALRKTLDGIMRGESLSNAFESTGFFPSFMCNMCQIGEMSDDLPRVMALLADYYEESARNRDEIKAALMYPAVVSFMMLLMILMALIFVLPHYALVFMVSDVPLPFLTRALMGFSDIIMAHWYLLLPAALALIIAPAALLRTSFGRSCFEYCLLNLPPLSKVYRQMVNLHFVQAMALLLQSSQPLAEAVLAASGIIANKWVARDLQEVAAGLQGGTAFWLLLGRIAYIDPSVSSLARVGEETGNMAEVFNHALEYSRYKFGRLTKQLNKLVEPAISLVLGLVLALVMLSIILPTFAMTDLMW